MSTGSGDYESYLFPCALIAAPSAPVICGSKGIERVTPRSFSRAAFIPAFFATPTTKGDIPSDHFPHDVSLPASLRCHGFLQNMITPDNPVGQDL